MKTEGSLTPTDLHESFSYPLTLCVKPIPFSPIRTPTACCVIFFVLRIPDTRRGRVIFICQVLVGVYGMTRHTVSMRIRLRSIYSSSLKYNIFSKTPKNHTKVSNHLGHHQTQAASAQTSHESPYMRHSESRHISLPFLHTLSITPITYSSGTSPQ